MNELREFINAAQAGRTKPEVKPRKQWDEHDMSIALDLRLTGVEAARRIGCTPQTVNNERREWQYEWR
ncbi:hypothetical protein [Brevibacterium oceani]|uniref:hypothetical protein n=1 Tax=Brevibacterium oceani TaxID=358099 RepID=UPI0015E789B0|nr:hypothetical protein [Brevibacterium oceani]